MTKMFFIKIQKLILIEQNNIILLTDSLNSCTSITLSLFKSNVSNLRLDS